MKIVIKDGIPHYEDGRCVNPSREVDYYTIIRPIKEYISTRFDEDIVVRDFGSFAVVPHYVYMIERDSSEEYIRDCIVTVESGNVIDFEFTQNQYSW